MQRYFPKTFFATCLICMSMYFLSPQPAQAVFPLFGSPLGGPVTVVGDVSPTSQQNLVENSLSTIAEQGSNASLALLLNKETFGDGLAFTIARTAVQQIVSQTITWINQGFSGSPAFMTDISGFMADIADIVVGDVIESSELGFLCSPFELDIKIALETQYNNFSQGNVSQCTLSDVSDNIEAFVDGAFNEGGWSAWFELTQGSTNDPLKAAFEAQLTIDAAIRNAQGEAIAELDWGDGFLSYKVCSDTQVASGAETNCTIVTPGEAISQQLNAIVGLPADSLIEADEINELIGAVFSQLGQQLLSGGLLSLGGSSDASQTLNDFGEDGSSSFLDAIAEEDTRLTLEFIDLGPELFAESIADERALIAVQEAIATTSSQALADYAAIVEEWQPFVDAERCNFDRALEETFNSTGVDLFDNTVRYQQEAVQNITTGTTNVIVLQELESRYDAATTTAAIYDITIAYSELIADGGLDAASRLAAAESKLEFRVVPETDALVALAEQEARKCLPN